MPELSVAAPPGSDPADVDDVCTFVAAGRGNSLVGIRYLTKLEIVRILAAERMLRKFDTDCQEFVCIILEHEELVAELERFHKRISAGHLAMWDVICLHLQLNRRVLNLLAHVRSFMDHNDWRLKHRFGEKSHQREAFKRARSTLYDAEFAYRFLEKLRNFTQHRSLPIHRVDAETAKGRDWKDLKFSPLCDRDLLLKSGFDWGALRSEIETLPATWNLYDTVAEAMPCYFILQDAVVAYAIKEVRAARDILAGLFSEVGYPDAEPVLVGIPAYDESPLGANVQLTFQAIPYELIKGVGHYDRIVLPESS